MNRPFPIRYSHIADLSMLRVEAKLDGLIPAGEGKVLLSVIQDWVKLVSAGGLSGERLAPQQSTALLTSSTISGGSRLIWMIETLRMDVRSFFSLENVLHYIHSRLVPLAEVIIETGLVQDGYRAPEAFPAAYLPTPYDLEREVTSRGLNLSLEFADDVEENIAEEVMARIGDWFCAASVGVFGNKHISPGESRFLIKPDPVWEPTGIEMILDEAYGDDACIDSLINVLTKAHHQLARIEQVSLVS